MMSSTAQPQSGLAMSTRCWSGCMKPSEELHVFASSPRRITEDPGGSSPTFPTSWLDCRRVGRLCSSLTQSWCAQVLFQSPAAVRFRNRRRKKQSQPHIRTEQQQFFWAVSFGSIGSSTWFPTFFTLPLRMEVSHHSLPHDLGFRIRCLFRRLLLSHRDQVLAVIFMWPGCRGGSHAMLCET